MSERSGRARVAALASVIVLMAAATPVLSDDEGARTMTWGVSTCDSVLAAIPVDADALEPHMPDGFEPATPEEFGLPPQPGSDAVLGVKAHECEEGEDLHETDGETQYGAVWSPAHPPEGLADDDLWFHFVAWDTLVPDDERRTPLERWGLPVHDGEADLSGLQETLLGYAYAASLEMGGDTYRFRGVSLLPEEDFAGPDRYADFMAGDRILARWEATADAHDDAGEADLFAGAGLVELPDDHWTAEVAGTTTAHALILASRTMSFEDGRITLAPRASLHRR